MKIKVRPPRSKVWEYSAEETQALLAKGSKEAVQVSDAARQLLAITRDHHARTGESMTLSAAASAAGITSRRKVQTLVDELERGALVTTKKLRERGQPRVILPRPSSGGGKS